jgi:hypothetical protein
MVERIDRMLDIGCTDAEILAALCEQCAPHNTMPEFAQGFIDYTQRKHQEPPEGAGRLAYNSGAELAHWLSYAAQRRGLRLQAKI